jgi:FAD/FMN-containing dehydrogenase
LLHSSHIYLFFTRKTSAGFNLTNLFVGSEGTLGFITKTTLKIYGLPETVVSAVCAFRDVKSAVDTCVQVLQSNIPIARIGRLMLNLFTTYNYIKINCGYDVPINIKS